MTIKSQGQSFNHVGVFLPEPVFAHGQLYEAFTGVRHHENLEVLVNDTFYQGNLLRISKYLQKSCNQRDF